MAGAEEALARLRELADPARAAGMSRYGIGGGTAIGVAVAERAGNDRPIVGKGASWALRAIGKRNPALHARAVETALDLRDGGPGTRWVGTDALREPRR